MAQKPVLRGEVGCACVVRLRDHPPSRGSIWPPPRPTISSGIPSDIADTRDTIGIIDTRGTIDVFHPAPSGVVEILDAFDIRD